MANFLAAGNFEKRLFRQDAETGGRNAHSTRESQNRIWKVRLPYANASLYLPNLRHAIPGIFEAAAAL
jgi:hypothetical protein